MFELNIKAIAFDFGNTLCPWDEDQYWEISSATLKEICSITGAGFDSAVEVFREVRDEDSARHLPQLRDNDLEWVWCETARRSTGRELTESEITEVRLAHLKAFVGVCCLTEGLPDFLEKLSGKYRLAVLSNYPNSECIRESLKTLGISDLFDKVIVSGDFGIVKPSRFLFDKLLDALGLPAQEVLFVGDDPVADVVGAWASGLPCVQVMNGSHKRKVKMMQGVFGTYIKLALDNPEFRNWETAKPMGIIHSVTDLKKWLEERSA